MFGGHPGLCSKTPSQHTTNQQSLTDPLQLEFPTDDPPRLQAALRNQREGLCWRLTAHPLRLIAKPLAFGSLLLPDISR